VKRGGEETRLRGEEERKLEMEREREGKISGLRKIALDHDSKRQRHSDVEIAFFY
jgi:hypothetical protein